MQSGNFVKNDTNRILMQGDIANAYGSINRLSVVKAVRKHILLSL